MKKKPVTITGILLAGGKSSRMGKEKGLIMIGKQEMYKYPLSVLESLCDEIIISTCKESLFPEQYTRICDEIPGIGPIGGLYTCLKRSQNQINIVLSYDLPLVKRELFDEMLLLADDAEIVVPELKPGNPEPLCGIYKKEVTSVLLQLIQDKVYSVHSAMKHAKTRILKVDESCSFFHPDLFLNINSESDLSVLPSDLTL